MTYAAFSTPDGVSKTPDFFTNPYVDALPAFNDVLTLLRAARAADDCLDGRWFDLAMSSYLDAAEDAWAQADLALHAVRAGHPDARDLAMAAGQMLLLMADGGGDAARLRERARKVRSAALRCFYSFDATLRDVARRLMEMADVMDQMISEAQTEYHSANRWSDINTIVVSSPSVVFRDAVSA
ncbi:MAG: hypothetical protein ACI93B_002295 [Yoonia sp.]|jgi:hypothetical protein